MRPQFLLIGMIFIATASYGQAQQKNKQVTLFSVDGSSIYTDEFIYLYKKNHQGRQEEFAREKIEEYLELFINFKLKVREAESRGLHNSVAFKNELAGYKEELKKPFVAEPDLLDKLVKEAYARLGEEVNASHILISLKPDADPQDTVKAFAKAEEIIAKLKQGEDFEKLAQMYSEDPSAKTNGGSLGFFTALQMVYPFEEAAFNLKKGEISNPVRTRFGYHVIRVEDKRPSSGEVEVSHILVRGEDDKAKETISDVYNQLQKGGDWEKLCNTYSHDNNTKNNGGRLRPFGPGALASAPQFEAVAFSLKEPGSISSPFQTSFGWHIVRLEKKIPLPPFSELEASLRRRVARDERLTIARSIVVEKRKNKLNYKQQDMALDLIIKLFADSSLAKGTWRMDQLKSNANNVLFAIGEVTYTVKDFGQFIESNQSAQGGDAKRYVIELFDQFVDESLAEIEDIQLQQSNPEYRNLANEYREGILLFSIMEEEVWNKASEDSVGQRRYYESQAQHYQAGERIEARIFSTSVRNIRDSIYLIMSSVDTLSVSDLKGVKVTGFRAYEKGEHKAVDNINWTIGVHKADAEGMYYLVEVSRLVAPGFKKFEEVRAVIISDYQDYLEKQWIAQLRNKYAVRINGKGKKKVISELTTALN